MVGRQFKGGTPLHHFGRTAVLAERFGQRLGIEEMEPPTLVIGFEHAHAQRGNEGPVLVAIGPLHFRHGLRSGVQAEHLLSPRGRFAEGMPEHIQSHRLRPPQPFEVAGPAAVMPAGIQGRTDVAAVMAGSALDRRRVQ